MKFLSENNRLTVFLEGRIDTNNAAQVEKERRSPDEEVQGSLRRVRLRLDDDEPGRGREEPPGALRDVPLPGGDEHHDGSVLQVVRKEDETAVA